MNVRGELKKSFQISAWFMFLTFPILVIRVNTVENVIEWRWYNMAIVGVSTFLGSALWRYLLSVKEKSQRINAASPGNMTSFQKAFSDKRFFYPALFILIGFVISFPFLFSMYQANIMITALIYVMLGLGLNIVVGLAGLLDLGYVAFYAVGAYSYGLLNFHFGLGFWTTLPIAAILAALAGILLGYPVLRLRGDYLAIVTLGFGEIIRLVLENWGEFSHGPSGIANIPRPSLLGIDMTLTQNTIFTYFVMIGLVLFTIFVVNRLQNSRIGRAWIALREDEIACQAMGIDRTRTKLTAFALGATWAGMGGVVFAAKTTFINPASFTIWESVIILCIVVLGGMGSILGVISGALVLTLLPEYLRAFSEYRMLIFGIMLVSMMVFRPEGIIRNVRRTYTFSKE
ncbi:MAG: branched-chain amino acid ABC transporter permease [Proteobacteria bacterium]|nr:branched-chain amino acid ABC transporter permease [Pseudomonadota bacterium]